MAKAYLIGQYSITNLESFKIYRDQVAKIIKSYGGKFLVRGAQATVIEGHVPGEINVVVEFPSQEAAWECYNSPEYQSIIHHRKDSTEGYMLLAEEYIDHS